MPKRVKRDGTEITLTHAASIGFMPASNSKKLKPEPKRVGAVQAALERGRDSALIYLAGPLSIDPRAWWKVGAKYFDACVRWADRADLAVVFYLPHVSIALHDAYPQPESTWLALNGRILEDAAAVIQLPPMADPAMNFSTGVAVEKRFAKTRGTPWFQGREFDPAREDPVNGRRFREFVRQGFRDYWARS